MELLFAYDDKIACDEEGNLYSGSTFSQSVFDRYLQFFSHITLLARHAPEDANFTQMNRLDSGKVSVVFLPDRRRSIKEFLNLKTLILYRKTLKAQITTNHAVIGRVPSTAGAIAACYCRKIGKPYLLEVVGCPWDAYRNHSRIGKIMAPFGWLRQQNAIRNAPYVLYVTSKFLQQRYPTNGLSVGISDVSLETVNDSILTKRMDNLQNHIGVWKIGTAGAVNVSYKGQQFVIEALAKLKAQGYTNFEYHLAGGGDQTRLCKLADKLGVSNQIVFDGSLPHSKVFDWLDSLDLYIQPSIVEAISRALIEAMSRGLPCFGSNVGGIPELLEKEQLFSKGSADEIADLLKTMTSSKMKCIAQSCFNTAKEYEPYILDEKRNMFYRQFANLCEEKE